MQALFPKSPFIPSTVQLNRPVCEHVIPAPAARRRNHLSMYKMLPAGMPDYLEVSVIHSHEGSERCVAAIYSGHTYLIHYELDDHIA